MFVYLVLPGAMHAVCESFVLIFMETPQRMLRCVLHCTVQYCTVLYCFVAVPSVRGVAAGLLHVLPEPAHLRRLHQEQGLPLLRLQAGDRGDLLPAAGPDVLPGEIPSSWKNADL